jgi:filamentous hemagglutinin family protein
MPTTATKACAWLAFAALAAQAQPAAAGPGLNQLPSGGQVTSGAATIQQGQGQAGAPTMVIQQQTPKAILQWDSFNVGRDAAVRFEQPSASSVALNRVLSTDPSQILGRIQANGQIILANPNGVLFGPSSRVDVGGLVVTVHDITNDDFLNDRWSFGGSGDAGDSGASGVGGITNQGELVASLGGYIALLAPQVVNEGVILAQEGSVALASGAAITLKFGAQGLVSVMVDEPVVSALIENRHLVRAPGGLVVMTAQSANAIFESVIQQSGQVQVPSVREVNGRILLRAGDKGTATVSGQLNTSSSTGRAGDIQVTGNRVVLEPTAVLEAKGATQGGEILVGGSWQGSDPEVQQSSRTVIEKGAQLNASGVGTGAGGTVVAWSNLQDGQTHAAGDFQARGGEQGGDGGRIETSGGYLNVQGATGSAAAPKGKGGEWLFDPYDITISRTNPTDTTSTEEWSPPGSGSVLDSDSIEALLDAGTNVTVSTGTTGGESGDITVAAGGGISSSYALANLTLFAANDITLNDAILLTGSGSSLKLYSSGAGTISLDGAASASEYALRANTVRLVIDGAGSITQLANGGINASNFGIDAGLSAVDLTLGTNRVGTLAADVASIALQVNEGINLGSSYGSGLYIGTIGQLSGVQATGTIDISNLGNVFVNGPLVAGDTSNAALVIEAGRGLAANAYTGANQADVILLNNPSISVGTGGRGTFYSGSYENAGAALASQLASGSHRFRYNSTRLAAGYSQALGTGLYGVFRQQPTLTITATSPTVVYGASSPASPSVGFTVAGLSNGDLQATVLSTDPSYSIAPSLSGAGFYTVGSHAITPSGAANTFGYALAYVDGSLTVTPQSVNLSSPTATSRAYDGTTVVTVGGTMVGETNDVVSLNTSGTITDKNVGTGKGVTFALTGADAANYELVQPGTTVNITARPLTVAGTVAANKIYDGTTAATITVGTLSGFASGETVTATATGAFNSKDVGVANNTVTATYSLVNGTGGGLASNYSLASTSGHAATISAKPLSATASASNKVYDGSTSATATLSIDSSGLIGTETVTATVSSATFNSKDVASANTVTVNGLTLVDGANGGLASNYSLATGQTAAATITPKSLTVTGSTAASKTYNGNTNATVTVGTLGGFISTETVTATATGVFNSKNVTTASSVVASYSLANGTNGGLATNYSLVDTTPLSASITPRDLFVAGTADNKVYDGNTIATATSLIDNRISGDDISIVAGSANFRSKNVGTGVAVDIYGITVAGADATNYALVGNSLTTTADIRTKVLTVSANDATKAYDGIPYNGGNGATYEGFVSGESTADLNGALAFGGSSQGATNVGSYVLTPNGFTSTNYSISYVDGALAVTPASLTVSADDQSKRYGDAVTFTGTEFTAVGLQNGETIGGVSLSSSGASAVADVLSTPYEIEVSAATGGTFTASNYDITYVDGSLQVNPAALTITANNASKTYGQETIFAGTEFTTGVGELKNSDAIDSLTLSSAGAAATAGVSAGPYTIEASAPQGLAFNEVNYSITYVDGSLTVNRKALIVTPTNISKSYGNTYSFTGAEFTSSGLQNSDAIDSIMLSSLGSSSTATVLGGPYSITGSSPTGVQFDAANYVTVFSSGLMTVTPASLTVSADDQSKRYGDAVTFTGTEFTAVGLQNGETIGGVSLSSSGASAVADVLSTPYEIEVSAATGGTFTASNYDITYVDGSLQVNPAALTITANNASKTYGQETIFAGTEFTTGVGELKNSDAIDSLTLSSAGAAATAGVSAGPYTIEASAPQGLAFNEANYSITYVDGSLTVSPKPLTISANNASKTYGQTMTFEGTEFTSSGLENSETIATVTLASSGVAAEADVGASPYTITAASPTGGTFSSANYSITYTDGELTVSPAPLVITALDDEKVYDGLSYSSNNGVSYEGFVNGESVSDLSGVLSYTGTSQAAISAGTYVITPQGLTSTNYAVTFNDGALLINPAPLLVTARDDAKTYDGLGYNGGNGVNFDGFVNGENEATADIADSVGALTFTGTSQGAVNAGNYTLTPGGLSSNNYLISYEDGRLEVSPKTITAITEASDKVYDGSVDAIVGIELQGLVGDETLGLVGDASFNSKNVVEASTVSFQGFTLANGANGGLAANYSLESIPDALASILPKPLAIQGTRVLDKEYDGGTTASVDTSQLLITELVNGETLEIAATGVFDSKNVGVRTVDVSLTLNDGSTGLKTNYDLVESEIQLEANITPKLVRVEGVEVIPSTHDLGKTNAIWSTDRQILVGIEPEDLNAVTTTINGAYLVNVPGPGRPVQLDFSLSGSEAANYRVVTPVLARGDLLPAIPSLSAITPPPDPGAPGALFVPPAEMPQALVTPVARSLAEASLGSLTEIRAEIAGWTPAQIQSLSTVSLKALQPEALQMMSAEQVQVLLSEQIQVLEPEQLIAVLPQLSSGQQKAVTNQQLTALKVLLNIQ